MFAQSKVIHPPVYEHSRCTALDISMWYSQRTSSGTLGERPSQEAGRTHAVRDCSREGTQAIHGPLPEGEVGGEATASPHAHPLRGHHSDRPCMRPLQWPAACPLPCSAQHANTQAPQRHGTLSRKRTPTTAFLQSDQADQCQAMSLAWRAPAACEVGMALPTFSILGFRP
jgi:hypothetical protein